MEAYGKHFDIPVASRFIVRAKKMQEDFNKIKTSNKRSNGPTDWHGVLGEIMFDWYMDKVENNPTVTENPIQYEWIEFVTTDTASADFEFDYGRTRTDVKTTRYSGLYYQPSNLKFDYYIKMTPIDFENGDLQKPKISVLRAIFLRKICKGFLLRFKTGTTVVDEKRIAHLDALLIAFMKTICARLTN